MTCTVHSSAPSISACCKCGRAMCAECYEYLIEGQPACAPCAYQARSGLQRRLGYALSVIGIFGTIAWVFRKKIPTGGLIGVIAAAIVIAIVLVATADPAKEIARRADDEEEPPPSIASPANAHPYRARVLHAAARISPKVSASATVFAVLSSLAIAAVALPTALELPRWLELEVVLGAWWTIFSVALTTLLYTGYRLRDDYLFVPPWKRKLMGGKKAEPMATGKGGGGGGLDFGGCSSFDGEAVVIGIAVIVAAIAFFGAAWLLAELALPLVFVLGYAIILRALGRVARDHHGCKGSLLRSIAWGAVWSTIYLLPFAVVIISVHFAMKPR